MKMLLRAVGTFRTGARGPQDEKGFATSALELHVQGFPTGNEFVAMRASDFRQISLVHSGKSVAPRWESTYPAFRLTPRHKTDGYSA